MTAAILLSPAEMVIMATLQGSPEAAHAEYLRIEALLINLQHTFPLVIGKVTASTLNVRDLPNTTAPTLSALPQGSAVEVWGRTKANDWLAVRCVAPPAAGWVARQYVTETA